MYPAVCSPGANGCSLEISGHEIGNISAVAFNFIVHEPSGIIEVVSERSRDSSFFRYRSISVSVSCVLKMGWVRKSELRIADCGMRIGGSAEIVIGNESRTCVPRKIDISSSMSRGVVVSSNEMQTAREPSARKLQPAFSACSKMTALDSTSTRIVSKKLFVCDFQTKCAQTIGQLAGQAMHAFRDCAQTARAVINRIHRCDDSEKNLSRANIARGFVAADVLLARLQREAISRASFGIVRNAHQATRHMAFVLIARGEVGRVRATKPERNAEALRITDRNIGAEFSGRFQ